MVMKNNFSLNLEKIEKHKQDLLGHGIFKKKSVTSLEDLQNFMSTHVYAVWDFMSLVKALQYELTPTNSPWVPKRKYPTRLVRFINDIVLCEESDIHYDGESYISHFDLYLLAMEEIGADILPVLTFVEKVQNYGVEIALDEVAIPTHARTFINQTFSIIERGKPHEIAAAFAFGRETIIPDMFKSVIGSLDLDDDRIKGFRYYLERHIEVDGDEHGHWALDLVEHLCEGNPLKIKEAEEAAIKSIKNRKKLWDAVVVAKDMG